MRKRNPNDVIIAFQSDVQASLEQWSAVITSVRDQPVTLQGRLQRRLLPAGCSLANCSGRTGTSQQRPETPSQLRTTITTEVDKALSARPRESLGLTQAEPVAAVRRMG